MNLPFRQVDVFGARTGAGNPVAVVHDASGLSGEQMQRFARWTNLSETTFLLPPEDPRAHYRVRIFTPDEELPFAGHPTLGTCHAWLEAGGVADGDVLQECGAGLVRIRRGERLAFAAPPLIRGGPVAPGDLERICAALRVPAGDVLDAAWVDNGPGWVAVLLPDADAVLRVAPGPLDGYFVGVVGVRAVDEVEVRAFVPFNGGTVEDPVTGSLNASVAPWLADSGRVGFPYVARQGRAVGHDGLVFVHRDADGVVWVGGDTATVIRGEVELGGDRP